MVVPDIGTDSDTKTHNNNACDGTEGIEVDGTCQNGTDFAFTVTRTGSYNIGQAALEYSTVEDAENADRFPLLDSHLVSPTTQQEVTRSLPEGTETIYLYWYGEQYGSVATGDELCTTTPLEPGPGGVAICADGETGQYIFRIDNRDPDSAIAGGRIAWELRGSGQSPMPEGTVADPIPAGGQGWVYVTATAGTLYLSVDGGTFFNSGDSVNSRACGVEGEGGNSLANGDLRVDLLCESGDFVGYEVTNDGVRATFAKHDQFGATEDPLDRVGLDPSIPAGGSDVYAPGDPGVGDAFYLYQHGVLVDSAFAEDCEPPPFVPPGPDPVVPPAQEVPEPTRLGGDERIETSVINSQEHFEDGEADAVVVARQGIFADAVTGTPLAANVNGPVLLTFTDSLADMVAEEIDRVLAADGTIYIMGGVEALTTDVEAALQALGFDVVRIAGVNRFETATLTADRLVDGGFAQTDQVLLADGGDFVPSTVAGPAAVAVDGVVLLTSDSTMPPETAAWLADHAGVDVTAIGDAAADAAPDAGAGTGDDEPDLSVAGAEAFFDAPPAIGVATFAAFADPLTGGTHIALNGGPLLFSTPDELPAVVADVTSVAGTVEEVFIYGGVDALSEDVATDVEEALAAAEG